MSPDLRDSGDATAAKPTAGSPRARRAAHRVLRRYPWRWRGRYGAEMRALLDEMPVTWRQVGDLALGAAREWVSPRAFGWPARFAAARIQVIRGLRFFGAMLVVEMLVHATVSPATVSNATLDRLEYAAIVVMMLQIARMILGFCAWRQKPRWLVRRGWFGPLRGPEIAAWFAGSAVWLVFRHAQPVPTYLTEPSVYPFATHLQAFIWAQMLFQWSARTIRLHKVLSSHLQRQQRLQRTW